MREKARELRLPGLRWGRLRQNPQRVRCPRIRINSTQRGHVAPLGRVPKGHGWHCHRLNAARAKVSC